VTPALWQLLARHWPLSLPRRRLVAAIGPEAVEAATRAGVLVMTPLSAGDSYPCDACAEPGCAMRVIDEGPDLGLSAVCELAPAQCLEERIPPDDAWALRVEPQTFSERLAAALGLQGTPEVAAAASWPSLLGARVFGRERVPVFLVPHPKSAAEPLRALGATDARVVIAIALTDVRGDCVRRLDGTKIDWVRLDDVVRLEDGRLAGDLTAVALRHRFDGFDLIAAVSNGFDLVLHPEQDTYVWRGRRLRLSASEKAAMLLHVLAEAPDEPVAKRHIAGILWPDDVRGKMRNPKPGIDIEARLRQAKEALTKALGDGPDIIENGRGYANRMRLCVPPSRVRWLSSAPPPELDV
jgi:hypothetical protein